MFPRAQPPSAKCDRVPRGLECLIVIQCPVTQNELKGVCPHSPPVRWSLKRKFGFQIKKKWIGLDFVRHHSQNLPKHVLKSFVNQFSFFFLTKNDTHLDSIGKVGTKQLAIGTWPTQTPHMTKQWPPYPNLT